MKHASFLCYLLFFLSASSGQMRHDVFIPVGESDSLDATYYLPSTAPPLSGYPAILFVHGFGLNKDWDTSNCTNYSAAGYMTMCFSVRGHGNSTGLSTIMGSQERSDLTRVIAYLHSIPGADTAHIGIIGGSQGGLHGLWAAADRLQVSAISADVIVPGWASDMLMNGCIRRTLLLLVKTNGVHYDASRDSLWEFLRKDAYDSLAARFPVGRDLDTTQLYSASTPILSLLKWQDHYFSAGSGIAFLNGYGATKKMYAGTHGHFSDQSETERLFQSDQVTRWMNYFLKGAQNGILDEPVFTYAYSSLPMDSAGNFTWTRTSAPQWPPDGVRPVRLYFGGDSLLTYAPPEPMEDSFIVDNLYRDTGYTFDTGYIEGFTGPNMDAALPRSMMHFETPPLGNDVQLAGTPAIHLFVRSAFQKFPMHVQIYEVDTSGIKYFVNRVNFTARHWIPGATQEVHVTGIPHAHLFRRGNRIRIAFTNIDRTNRKMPGDFPFVLPLFATASATIYADQLHPSYIELPLIGSPTAVADPIAEIPRVVRMEQNYPNPFNPVTVIRYSLFVRSEVTLWLFDVLGRKMGVLVNGVRGPGEDIVSWDAAAAGTGSGVYYYRLTATTADGKSQSITRKMMFIK